MAATVPAKSTAFATIDLDRPGKHVGFVMIPHSPTTMRGRHAPADRSDRERQRPTVILEAGNHGDEYEGQITITEPSVISTPVRCPAGSS